MNTVEPTPAKISATIITFNEEENIKACIESVRPFVSEIIVVDSNSSDRTCAVAKACGAKVVKQAFLGDGAQKYFAAQQCSHDWIFSIDADERLIQQNTETPWPAQLDKALQYAFKRRNHIFGARIYHGGSYPDWVTRLYNRTTSQYSKFEHGRVEGATMRYLNTAEIDHYTHANIEVLYRKAIHYAVYGAKDLSQCDKTPKNAFLSGFWMFAKLYLIKLGFLDGRIGFHWCYAAALRSFLKHEIYRHNWRHRKAQKKEK